MKLTNISNIDSFSKLVDQLMTQFLDNNNSTLDVKTLIYQAKFTVQLFKFIRNMFDCFELNKFVLELKISSLCVRKTRQF